MTGYGATPTAVFNSLDRRYPKGGACSCCFRSHRQRIVNFATQRLATLKTMGATKRSRVPPMNCQQRKWHRQVRQLRMNAPLATDGLFATVERYSGSHLIGDMLVQCKREPPRFCWGGLAV